MDLQSVFSRIASGLKRFASDPSGVAAVEFALILPFMFLLYVGLVETTQYVSADRKSIIMARTLSDLTAQPNNLDLDQTSLTYNKPIVTDTTRTSIFSLATATFYPFDATNAAMRITQFAIDNNNGAPRAFTDWMETCTWQANATCSYGPNSVFTTPNAQRCDIDPTVDQDHRTVNSYVIRGEVSYHYKPILASLFASSVGGTDGYFNFLPSGGIDLFNRTYASPRSNEPIIRKFNDGSSTYKLADGTPNDARSACPNFKP